MREANPIIESADWQYLSLPLTIFCCRLQEVIVDLKFYIFALQSSHQETITILKEIPARTWNTSLRVSLRTWPWMRGSRCSIPWSTRTRLRCLDAGLRKYERLKFNLELWHFLTYRINTTTLDCLSPTWEFIIKVTERHTKTPAQCGPSIPYQPRVASTTSRSR